MDLFAGLPDTPPSLPSYGPEVRKPFHLIFQYEEIDLNSGYLIWLECKRRQSEGEQQGEREPAGVQT